MNSQDRGPAKRKVKPVEAPSLLDFDLGEGESSDDSDFRIEDHAEESDDYSINTDDEKKQDDNSGSSDEDSESEEEEEETQFKSSKKMGEEMSVAELLERAKQQDFQFPGDIANVLICSGCLGSRSDDFNEIVECDGCGVTVHEGCYGVSDVTSESSTVSSASTEPWFCEACKAGVTDPSCELCPNKGGIFKETEVGRWVHLVCALYVPGVAFSEVERLSGVTLFEMAYSGWGARRCALCRDAASARTGVAVGCDAGLCRTFFHVTCGQREGLLAEAHSEEAEQADPFYAHCKLHSDKALVKKRKRNWLALQLRTAKRKVELQNNLSEEEKKRIQRKLVKYTRKYQQQKENRNPPWVPTQKMARMLYSSASAMRAFQRKAECMGIDTHALEFQDAQMAALKDVSRRWHIPPAFSVEFVGYYLERNSRVTSLRDMLQRLTKENETLLADNDRLRIEYDEAAKENSEKLAELQTNKQSLRKLYDAIVALCPKKATPAILAAAKENSEKLAELQTNKQSLRKLYDAIVALCPKKATPAILDEQPLLPPEIPRSTPKVTPQQLQKRSKPVPTAAALKMGVGFPLSDLHPDARCGKVLSTSFEAGAAPLSKPMGVSAPLGASAGATVDVDLGVTGVCAVCGGRGAGAGGVLVTCDTCHRCYHLGCLNPPLARPPKKSKLYGWQCSECDKTSDSEPEVMEKKQPRRSRIRYSKDGAIISEPRSPESKPNTPSPKNKHKTKKITKLATPSAENASPIKLTIKPFEFSSENEAEIKSFKREKKIKKSKIKDFGESSDPAKKLKRSFTSPNLTNTPLMSITPIVADSPNDSHNENSNASTSVLTKRDESFSSHLSFSSLLGEKEKERDSKAIESSIENTLANLSSDIATYKANRKRRKEKHRSRYSPDFMRSPSKHKHKRKKKNQDMENPGLPHPRITIKIKPIPKPDGSLAPQMFYVPSDSNDAPPSHHTHKHKHHSEESTPAAQESSATLPNEPVSEDQVRGRGGRGSSIGGGAGPGGASGAALTPMTECDVCSQPGTTANLVRCDECSRRYHFSCLDPPLARNPKKRGYSWHCADCDPTDQEDIN